MTLVELSRLQFAITALYHFLFVPLTLGLAVLLGAFNLGAWGWALFGVVWGVAAVGVTLKAAGRATRPIFSTGLYLAMGWLVAVAIDPLFTRVPLSGLLWLLAGGLFYTAGVAFFAADSRLRYSHFVWHVFVVAGTVSHYFAVLWYAA